MKYARPNDKQLSPIWRYGWRWICVVALGAVLAACGGGGGADGTLPQQVVVPDFQSTVQAAVLKSGVQQDPSTLKRDAVANSFIATGGDWAVGQVFVFEGQMYKVVNVLANADGMTKSVSTTSATLDETFSDLKFNYTIHPVTYDEAGKFKSVNQTGVVRRIQSALQTGLLDSTKGTDRSLSCLIPSQELQLGEEFGIEYTADCSLSQLLLDETDSTDWLRIKGKLAVVGKSVGYKDIKEKTEYTDRNTSVTLAVTGVITKGSVDITKKWADNLCAKFRSKNVGTSNYRCEVKDDGGELSIKFARGLTTVSGVIPAGPVPIPVYLSTGIAMDITFSISGEATIGATVTHSIRSGYINGAKVLTDDGFKTTLSEDTGAKANGELDIFVGGYLAGGMGNLSVLANEVKVDAGVYWAGTAQFPPHCLKSELGLRAQVDVTVLRNDLIPGWDGFSLIDGKINRPLDIWAKTWPAGCDGIPGTVKLKYAIAGKNNYAYDESSAGTSVDVYTANYALIDRDVSSGLPNQFTVDLEDTVAISGKALAFEVTVLDASKGAWVMAAASLFEKRADTPSTKRYKAVINTGDTGYGDTLKIRISAYVPGDRATTIKTRDVTIRIEPPMVVNPTFSAETTFFGDNIYKLRYDFLGQTTTLLQSGYIEMENGMREDLEKEAGAWKTTSLRGRGCDPCKPVKMVLFSLANAKGAGQSFPFVEETGVRVGTLTVSPSVSSVGDRLLITLEGRRIPSTVELDLPFCGFIEEERGGSTEKRVFSCRTTGTGKDLLASVKGVDSAVAVYSITPGCPAEQKDAAGQCMPLVTGISPLVAIAGVPSTFTISGQNLPLTAVMSLAEGSCDTPTKREQLGFTVVCTPGGVAGDKVVTIKTDTLANGGAVIDATRTVSVSTVSVPAPSWSLSLDRASITALGGVIDRNVTFVPGRNGVGSAAKFGGLALPGSIRIPNSAAMQFGAGGSFDVWARVDVNLGMSGYGGASTTAWAMALLAKSHDASGVALLTYPASTAYPGMGRGALASFDPSWQGCVSGAVSTSDTGVVLGDWFRITATMSSTGGYAIYINKQRMVNCPGAKPNFGAMNRQDLYLGKFSDSWYPLNGALQDLRIYAKALTAEEVAALP